MGLQRHLKVAGIFARLTLRDGKPATWPTRPVSSLHPSPPRRYRELAPLLRLVDEVEGTRRERLRLRPALSAPVPRFTARAAARRAALALPPAAARHVQVLRLQPGDRADPVRRPRRRIRRARRATWAAARSGCGRRAPRVEREAARPVHLAVGMPANERMDWLVEKAAELGAASSSRCWPSAACCAWPASGAQKKQAHWQGVADRGLRAVRPQPRARGAAGAAADGVAGGAGRGPASGARRCGPSRSRWRRGRRGERDFAERARGRLERRRGDAAASSAAGPVHLGPRVLRSETAPLAALSLLTLG
jgi:16S rRNA (uracil1498-N3)-methyltransferase